MTSKLPVNARRILWSASALIFLFTLYFLSVPKAVLGATTGAISQQYQTNSTGITTGELLSLSEVGSSIVEPANSTMNASRLIGVAADKPLLELSGEGAKSVQVVVGGTSSALVSNINGPVKVGDKITASPVSGVGMKASHSAEVVGIAQADLSSVPTVTRNVSGTDGKNISIKIGLLPIAVIVEYYSVASSAGTASSFVPPFLQSLADQLTGKQVSPLRVLFGSALLVMGFAAVTFMLYVAIRSGIISIGRNPLAERALRKGLVDVIIAALGVLTITAVVVYGLLLI